MRKWLERGESPQWGTERKRTVADLLSGSSVISHFPVSGAVWQLQNHLGWKSPPRPSSPAVLPALPNPTVTQALTQAQRGNEHLVPLVTLMLPSVKVMKINK